MNTRDEQFFKDHGLTQQQLAAALGVAQQTLAHYEVGRARLLASMLPTLARPLTLSMDELMGLPGTAAASRERGGKRGPPSWQQQIAAVSQLLKAKQQFVSERLEKVLCRLPAGGSGCHQGNEVQDPKEPMP